MEKDFSPAALLSDWTTELQSRFIQEVSQNIKYFWKFGLQGISTVIALDIYSALKTLFLFGFEVMRVKHTKSIDINGQIL